MSAWMSHSSLPSVVVLRLLALTVVLDSDRVVPSEIVTCRGLVVALSVPVDVQLA